MSPCLLLAQTPVERLGFLGCVEAGIVYLMSGAPAPAAIKGKGRNKEISRARKIYYL